VVDTLSNPEYYLYITSRAVTNGRRAPFGLPSIHIIVSLLNISATISGVAQRSDVAMIVTCCDLYASLLKAVEQLNGTAGTLLHSRL